MYMLKVKKKGFHLEEGKSYLCLDIINTDQAMLVGEDNNITVASIFECQFAGMVEIKPADLNAKPVAEPEKTIVKQILEKKVK